MKIDKIFEKSEFSRISIDFGEKNKSILNNFIPGCDSEGFFPSKRRSEPLHSVVGCFGSKTA